MKINQTTESNVMTKPQTFADELEALGIILGVLEPLDDEKRHFVLKTVSERLGISPITTTVPLTGSVPVSAGNQTQPLRSGEVPLANMSPKEFLKSKLPSTDAQRIACLAFYLTHARKQNHFKTGDLRKLNTEAAAPKLSNPAVTVMNATAHSRLLSPAGGGKKQITTIGEDLVNALPDQEAVKLVLSQQKSGKRKKKAAKTASKKNKQ